MKPERRTRKEKIDRQLARAGWPVGSRRLLEEFSVWTASKVGEPIGGDGDTYALVDYVLIDRFGKRREKGRGSMTLLSSRRI